MRPTNLKTKIFLDSGDPQETRQAIALLGFLDGQTTNPSLIAKNPATAGRKFSQKEILDFYQGVVEEVSGLIPKGSVSIEVYADAKTKSLEMMEQAIKFYEWIPNAHIKFPTTTEGLAAAEDAAERKMRVNMTLVFSQAQAAAVYAATKGAGEGQMFVSPFVGRLDDTGENGMDLIKNILKMYGYGDGHVQVLTASVRSLNHFVTAIEMGSDIITAPLKILKEWADAGMPDASSQLTADSSKLKPIEYQDLSLEKNWQEYDVRHELTEKGISKFVEDWNGLIHSSLRA